MPRRSDPRRRCRAVWSFARWCSWTWFFLAWVGLYLAVQYGFEAREEERRSSQLRIMAQSAKLRALHYQINPHFLFNSFNSVSALILDGRPADANAMVERLAGFFPHEPVDQSRYRHRSCEGNGPADDLSGDRTDAVSRPRIHRRRSVRSGARCGSGVSFAAARGKCDQAWRCRRIARRTLLHRHPRQPAGRRLEIAVENSCVGRTARGEVCGTNTGLRNVRDRLLTRYGGAATLKTERIGVSRFRAIIDLPLEYMR